MLLVEEREALAVEEQASAWERLEAERGGRLRLKRHGRAAVQEEVAEVRRDEREQEVGLQPLSLQVA